MTSVRPTLQCDRSQRDQIHAVVNGVAVEHFISCKLFTIKVPLFLLFALPPCSIRRLVLLTNGRQQSSPTSVINKFSHKFFEEKSPVFCLFKTSRIRKCFLFISSRLTGLTQQVSAGAWISSSALLRRGTLVWGEDDGDLRLINSRGRVHSLTPELKSEPGRLGIPMGRRCERPGNKRSH